MRKTTALVLEQDLAEVGLRNQARAAEVIKQMGSKYACHPTNLIHRDPGRTRFMPVAVDKASPAVLWRLHRGGK